MSVQTRIRQEITYPESDGKPMADNTKQFEYITTIKGNLDAIFRNDPNVFVAGDLLWYPLMGDNKTRSAPDVMVVFGRPKGHRGSYLQWQEENIAPQVVFEILSPSNRPSELVGKFQFYERFGVEEYYVYDPDRGILEGWLRVNEGLQPIEQMEGWTSPRLGVRFELAEGELVLYRPDGERFMTMEALDRQRLELRQELEIERQRAEAEHRRVEQLAERLRTMGIDPDQESLTET